MSADQSRELSELLKQTREYVRYFGELGAETIDAESAEPARVATLGASATRIEQPSETANPPLAVPARHAQKSVQLPPPTAKSAAALPAPQDSLFGEATPAGPSLPLSTETLEDIW